MRTVLGGLTISGTGLSLLDAGLKITLLLGGLLLALLVMRSVFNVSAARRASVAWLAALAIPVIILTSFVGSAQRVALIEVQYPVAAPRALVSIEPVKATTEQPLIGKAIHLVATALNMPSATAATPLPPAVEETPAEHSNAGPWLVAIWLGGITLVALRLGIGVIALNRSARRFTTPAEADPVNQTMLAITRELGLRRAPRLLLAADKLTMPMTWGAHRHCIVLPAAASTWSPERLRLVLQHELNHVKRRDCLAAWTLRLLLAPVWFHPLAWLLARHSSDLRERACDDAVALKNEDIDRYAHELVELSRGHRGLTAAVAMARPQRLKARIVALYCPRIDRGASTGVFRSSVAGVLAICLLPMFCFSACKTTEIAQKKSSDPVEKTRYFPTEPKMTITPKPSYRKGEKKVVLRAIELTHKGNIGFVETHILKQYAEGEPSALTAADLADLPDPKGFDMMSIAPFPTGRTHKFKITREFIYPSNPEADRSEHKMTSRDVGVMGDALVKPLPDGKLSVDINYEVVEFTGFTKDTAGVQRPEFVVRKIKSVGPMTIENGGGISPFLVREDVQQTVDKVPILGDLPLVGGLFRSKAENRFSRMLMIQVQVSDR